MLDAERSVRLEFGGLVMGGLLLKPGLGDRSSLGCRLRIRITLWESSGCESPGIEHGLRMACDSSALGPACAGRLPSEGVVSCVSGCVLIRRAW